MKINHIYCVLTLMYLPLATLFISCEDEMTEIPATEVASEFTADQTEIFTGGIVTYEEQSTGTVTHWSWTFEGGTPETSFEKNPEVVYEGPGIHEVKLVVSNAKYTDVLTKSEYITVNQAPQPITADFSVDSTSILSGGSLQFTDESTGGPTEWSWEFIPELGNSITSTEQNPEITFDAPGIYSVKLIASNGQYSGEELKENYITVIDPSEVAADFSTDEKLTYSGQEIAFSDLSAGEVTSWEWTFEGGSPSYSSEQNPSVTYNSAGKYKVTLKVSNDSNTSSEEKEGYITVIPGEGLLTLLPFNGSGDDKGPLKLTVENSSGTVSFTGTDRTDNTNATAVFNGEGILKIPAVEEKQLGASSYSIGVWIKTENPSRMMIWEEGGGGAGLPQAWLRINDNASDQLSRFNVNTGPIINIGVEDGISAISDNRWHYILCVRNEVGTSKFYLDGQLIEENANTDITSIDNELGLIVGGQDHNDEIVNKYSGQMDDLVIYKRVLSEDEITLLSEF